MRRASRSILLLAAISGCAANNSLPGAGGDGSGAPTDGAPPRDAGGGSDGTIATDCDKLTSRLACEAAQGAGCIVDTCCGNFTGCYNPNEKPTPCAADCVNACRVFDEAGCTAAAGCHAVYQPFEGCGCAPAGCCTLFDHCADGATATCYHASATCNQPPPDCQGDFVVAYKDLCYEGCVHQIECAMTP